MFNKSNEDYKSKNSGWRKYVYAAIGATAVFLGGAALYGDVQEDNFNA